MSTRAKALFDEIENSPLTAIAQMIADQRQESDYLEFKSGSKLNEKAAKKYWSQACSGFGNTEGGVVIWGVDARKTPSADDPLVQIDAAIGPDYVSNAVEFAEMLKRVQLDATVDSLSAEIQPYPVSGQAGYVVCFVPEGKNKPYRAALDETKNYYQRVGDSFIILSHSLLRSLFYPRIAPSLFIEATVEHGYLNNNVDRFLQVTLVLCNSGTGTARNVVGHVKAEKLFAVKHGDGNKPAGGSGDTMYFRFLDDLHPGQRPQLAVVNCEGQFTPPASINIETAIYCLDQPEQIIPIDFNAEEIAHKATKRFLPKSDDVN